MIAELVTQKIRVKVRPYYLRESSDPKKGIYVWAYQIQIQNQGSETVQLLTRHWIIREHARGPEFPGGVEEVKGEGVVGKRPILRAGESFEYTSYARLGGPTGQMHGTYEMQDRSGKRFIVRIPQFNLEFPIRGLVRGEITAS